VLKAPQSPHVAVLTGIGRSILPAHDRRAPMAKTILPGFGEPSPRRPRRCRQPSSAGIGRGQCRSALAVRPGPMSSAISEQRRPNREFPEPRLGGADVPVRYNVLAPLTCVDLPTASHARAPLADRQAHQRSSDVVYERARRVLPRRPARIRAVA
jgi:hypothetical protein